MTPAIATLSVSLDAPIATSHGFDSARALTGQGLRDVLAERISQIDDHGFDLDHDLQHAPDVLVAAAASYANTGHDQLIGRDHPRDEVDPGWPWEAEAWRPGTARDNLVNAAAILLAAVAFTAPAASSRSRALTLLAAAAIAISGAIGFYHAGVEAGMFEGITTCSTTRGMSLQDIVAAPLIRCDQVQWSLFGISMAGWNAILSLGGAALIITLALKGRRA